MEELRSCWGGVDEGSEGGGLVGKMGPRLIPLFIKKCK